MYHTEGVDAVATITELRADTTDLLDQVAHHTNGILVQRNNRPQAVLLPWKTYIQLTERLDLEALAEELRQEGTTASSES